MLQRRFAPLFWTQFFSALNDNFLKNALVFTILADVAGAQATTLVTMAGALFIAPFFFLSGLGGQLADRFDKAEVARSIRLAEIGIAILAAVGLIAASVPVLFATLFGFGVIAALFGPVKYGILPDHLREDELPAGNALVEGAIIQTFNPARSQAQTDAMTAGSEASVAYITELMAMRRVAPKDDLVSDLVAMKDGGADISDDEIKVNCLTLLVAGNLTTTDLIGNGVRLFLTHPEQLAKLMADPSLIGAAVEEILRFEPPVDQTGRVASRDLEIGGCPVKAHEQLSPSLRSANRDPDVFPDPDAFDITRARAPHVAFGGGAHICLGAPLARIEAQSAFLGLFRRYPNLTLVDEAPKWRSLPFFRGLERLEVRAG